MKPLAVLHLRPACRFAYVVDHYGPARSRRRASARRGEARLYTDCKYCFYHVPGNCVVCRTRSTANTAMYGSTYLVPGRKRRDVTTHYVTTCRNLAAVSYAIDDSSARMSPRPCPKVSSSCGLAPSAISIVYPTNTSRYLV